MTPLRLAGLAPIYLRATVVHKMTLVLTALDGIIPVLLATVWITVGREYHVASLSEATVVPYYVRVAVTAQLTSSLWVPGVLGDEVHTGALVNRLGRPASPYLELGIRELCRCSVRCLPFALVLMACSFWFYAGGPPGAAVAHVAAYLVELLAGFALGYGIGFVIGTFSFWLSDVRRAAQLWFGALLLLGGWLSPTSSVLPGPLRTAVDFLPFRLLLAAPVSALELRTSFSTIAFNMTLTLAWLAAISELAYVLWRRGLRRYDGGGR